MLSKVSEKYGLNDWLRRDDGLERVGGKGRSLAKMSNAGFHVAGGFLVTTEAYRSFIADNNVIRFRLGKRAGWSIAENGDWRARCVSYQHQSYAAPGARGEPHTDYRPAAAAGSVLG